MLNGLAGQVFRPPLNHEVYTWSRWAACLLFILLLLLIHPGVRADPLIIDHTCTELGLIDQTWIVQAKEQLRICYGHTSHGSQLVTGMQVLMDDPAYEGLFDFNRSGSVEPGVLSLHDGTPSGDLGNPDRTTWASLTREYLDGSGSNCNMVIWSWCGQADTTVENIDLYLDLMNQLEIDYPDVTFVYMTGHLNGTGEEGNLHARNNQIRAFCLANDKVLFDFADIESYDPDGSYFLDLYADDGCNYSGGNWAEEWCDVHPGECESCSCAHSHCLNCQQKGKASWWMFARVAGWNPAGPRTVSAQMSCTPLTITIPATFSMVTELVNECADYSRSLAGRISVQTASGQNYDNWRSGWATVDPGQTRISAWNQFIPARSSLVGGNVFALSVVDVTAAPYNQPPYPASGDTASDICTVTATAP